MDRTISREKAGTRTTSFEIVVRTRGLRKAYSGVVAADGVDLEVRRGEIFGLLGPGGAGKTTLLEILGGREKPDAGEIEVTGHVAVRLRDAAPFDYLMLHETLAFFADLHDADCSPTRVRELLERASLTDRAGFTVEALSSDEKQQFSLALALVNEPGIILLDEPTAGLDRSARREVWGMVRRMRATGASVLLATGDTEEARELCDRVALMDRGRIIARGAPYPLIQGPSLDAVVATAVDVETVGTPDLLSGVMASDGDGELSTSRTGFFREAATPPANPSEESGVRFTDVRVRGANLENHEDALEALAGRILPVHGRVSSRR